MSDFATASNENKSIKLSLNAPVALIIGAAGFVGSRLAQEFLKRNIQVIGVDNFSTGSRQKIEQLLTDKKFHLLEQSIIKMLDVKLPRLDYAIFAADDDGPDRLNLYRYGVPSFLKFIKDYSPKIAFVSDIKVYDPDAHASEQGLKQAEIYFAKFVKEHKLNGRIVRLASLFGPGMKFLAEDKLHRLLKQFAEGTLSQRNGILDLATRALFIDDAIDLVVKSLFGGATSHKIYDGALYHPIKLSEIKRLLLEPSLLAKEIEVFTSLPEWPTPNLEKTIKELSWHPKKDFKQALIITTEALKALRVQPEVQSPPQSLPVSPPSFISEFIPTGKIPHRPRPSLGRYTKNFLQVILVILLIGYGLVYPLLKITVGQLIIPSLLARAETQIDQDELSSADSLISTAKVFADSLSTAMPFLAVTNQLPYLQTWLAQVKKSNHNVETQLLGTSHLINGLGDLSKASAMMMGSEIGEPDPIFHTASIEFLTASLNLSQSSDTSIKALAEQGQTLSELLSLLTDQVGDRMYLLIVSDNSKQRLGGGQIESIGKLHVIDGKVTQIKFVPVSSLNPQLVSQIEELSSYPDFPTLAKELEMVYKQGTAESVDGVISLDTTATSKLIASLGGVSLSDYSALLTGDNLSNMLTKYSAKEEFFLSSVENQLFANLSFLPHQKTFALFQTIQDLLAKKHLLFYLDNQTAYSYLLAHDVAGAIPRQSSSEGVNDFLGVISAPESSSPATLKKSIKLTSSIDEDGGVTDDLKLTLQNLSAASSSAQVLLYLPQGVDLTSATWGGSDETSSIQNLSDYSRSGFLLTVPLLGGELQELEVDYKLADSLQFDDTKQSSYTLAFFKQNGEELVPFDWTVKRPSSLKIKSSSLPSSSVSYDGVNFSQGLSSDTQFDLILSK